MITGSVNFDLEAIIRLRVRGTNGQEQEIEAIIDTGFGGWLSLRPSQIVALGLPYIMPGSAIIADGSEITFNVYEAVLVWDGQDIVASIDESDVMPCIGMSLLEGYDLFVRARDGGIVTIIRSP